MILPKAILAEIGAASGTAMEISVERGRVVASPIRSPRDGWAEAAAAVAAAEDDPDEAAWQAFGSDGDDELAW